jgi:hypothetical protein
MTSLDRDSQRAKLLIGNLEKLTYAEKAKLPSTYLDDHTVYNNREVYILDRVV